jgi:dihydrofolate synthase/folylpolyglutamate synthase
MLSYEAAVEYLYQQLPNFQKIGARAYKPGLHTTRVLCRLLGNPQKKLKIIHVAGTNGKGSTSSMVAAVLQESGYKTGLYTSPHLFSFNERIRINGQVVEDEYVRYFVSKMRPIIEVLRPSFFEVTVAMALGYFAHCKVDVAVVEVGMGGRLDSTNVVEPILSVITSIGFDHMEQLGDTLPKIASEKAGIIKHGVPVVVGEQRDPAVYDVFSDFSTRLEAPLYISLENVAVHKLEGFEAKYEALCPQPEAPLSTSSFELDLDLKGSYQLQNLRTVLTAINRLNGLGYGISVEAIQRALSKVCQLTGLKGRWQVIREAPFVVCDTAHNEDGLRHTIAQFGLKIANHHRFVVGFVKDKSLEKILSLFPTEATYYFCQPDNARALPAPVLAERAASYGLKGNYFISVTEALNAALADSEEKDAVYVGGSTFVVADLHEWLT